jgi:hypothetical protein
VRALLTLACPLIATAASAVEPASPIAFVDRAPDAGITVVNRCGAEPRLFIPESNGTGAAWLDHDLDGDLDLYVVNGNGLEYLDGRARLRYIPDASDRLYRNDGGWRFRDVTEEAGVTESGWGNGVAAADVENDGDPDLYVANLGPDRLWLNEGDGTFRDATAERGLGHAGWSTGAAFGDVDRDGDLDLYVPCYVEFDSENPPEGGRVPVFDGVEVGYGPEGENPGINPGAPDVFYLNDGRGFFTDATAERGFALEKALCSYAAVFCDVDGDGWQDLLVTNDQQPSQLFVNRGEGFFAEEGEERGFARGPDGKVLSSMGLAVADADGDGDPDAFVTNFDFEPNSLRLNDGRGHFTEAADAAGLNPELNRLGWGCGFLDAELDGDLDLFVANGHVIAQCEQIGMSPWRMANHLFLRGGENGGVPAFALHVPPAASALAVRESSRGAAFGDADADGDVDIVIIDMDRPPQVLENRCLLGGRWLAVELRGTRSPRDAYGARVEVEAGGRTRVAWKIPNQGIYSSNDPVVHFGLGAVDRVDRVRVVWTSGATSELVNVEPDRRIVIREPEQGG